MLFLACTQESCRKLSKTNESFPIDSNLIGNDWGPDMGIFKKSLYIYLRERESEHKQDGQKERDRETHSPLRVECNDWLDLTTLRP